MRSEWRTVRLAELGRIITGKTPPSAVDGCFGGSALFVTPSDYDGSKYIRRTARTLTLKGAEAIRGVRIPGNAVMVTCIGSDMGKVALSASEAFTNQQINTLVVESDDQAEYVYYNLLMRKKELRAKASGSAQPILNKSAFGAIEIELPSVLTQIAVVDVLKSIDDRIDLLRQTNTTLESIAQAQFKSWFIDFDPVRAKAEGREPEGMGAATAALFPAEFEESELGLIPKGWRIGTLGEVCSNPRAQAKPGQMPADTPYIGLEHMPRKSIALDSAGVAEGLESGKFWFDRDDILFGKLRPYFHKVGLAPFRGVCSTDILVIRPKLATALGFVAMHASSDALISHTTQLSNGARMPRTSWGDIEAYRVVHPREEVLAAFNEIVQPMFKRIHANIEKAGSLASTRDTLLPRLISGKLRLPEAEAQIEEAIA